ncbi:hypothetical protein [Streptomyces sp. NBC_00344]|uniref:hypothetical protein n=1 Tax=Streptomyces sp. NBC_00344 TaxID=2975720 RepID=UPI002E212A83
MPASPTRPDPARAGRTESRRPVAPPSVPPSVPPSARPGPPPGPSSGSANDVVRWAAFCCVLVPLVLLVHGSGIGDSVLTGSGLVAVTAACRLLLRQSERGAARSAGRPGSHRRTQHGWNGRGAHRGARRPDESAPVN